MIGYHTPERLLLTLPAMTVPYGITLRFLSHYPVVCFPNKIIPLTIDALANPICHARVTASGIHDFNELPSGFPIKITSGLTIWKPSAVGTRKDTACLLSISCGILLQPNVTITTELDNLLQTTRHKTADHGLPACHCRRQSVGPEPNSGAKDTQPF
jgi:hypothetical protein